MNKNLFILIILAIVYSCTRGKSEFTVKGSVDLKDGSMIYRIIADSNQQPKVIDSVSVKSKSFMMKGSQSSLISIFYPYKE